MSLKPAHLNAVGQRYHDFEVIKSKEIPELQCFLRELVHLPTGAIVMHISNDDPENMFCLSFQTLPDSSNGVAHILEHTVLCGSEKFPVKDPFFGMTRRSLNTFMNAMTGSDFTCYPAASQVPKDLYNLLEVYLDAVFHPNLNELSFLQEGHRFEFSTPNDPESPLEHKGIVFNEMKGALSSSHARLAEAMNQALFPDLTYGHNSGGDPKEIPSLSYLELCAFHQKFYHPSRCLFFFYGNMPLEGHLDFLAEHALTGVKPAEPLPPLPTQPRFLQRKSLTREYPVSHEENLAHKTFISFGWLTCHILNQSEVLALSVLELLLMDTDASPLKHALLQTGLCKQASISTDVEISEIPVVITLSGCNPEDADRLESVLYSTLNQIVQEGIPLAAVDNAIHQLEIARSEITGNHAPFGLSLFLRSALLKQHGGESEDGLIIHSLFEGLRRRHLQDPTYLTGLIRNHFIDNTHSVRLVMIPDKQLSSREHTAEVAELERIKQSLTAGQVKTLVERANELSLFQKKQEEDDTDLLPKIALEDVPTLSRDYPLAVEKFAGLDIFHHNCFTNEIIYASLSYGLPQLTEADLPILRFFISIASQVGSGGRPYRENLEYIQAHTGGVGASFSFNVQASDSTQFFPRLEIKGKALHGKANKLFPLLKDMVTSLDFSDPARIKTLLLKHHTSLHAGLTSHALRYAINLASSSLDIPSKIANILYGIDYYQTVHHWVANIEESVPNIVEQLIQLQNKILGLADPHLVLTCNNEIYYNLKQHHFYGLEELPKKPFKSWVADFTLDSIPNQGRIIASPVAFTSCIFKTPSYIDPDTPALIIAASLFENLVLHPLVREQGGAYGGGASCNSLAGNFGFYAYRDPNISNTLKAFKTAAESIAAGNFDEVDLEEAKLEVIQGLDAPVAPGSRGELAYSRLQEGRPTAMRQAFRDRLLSLKQADVIQAIHRQILPKLPTSTLVVFAGKELLEKENELLEQKLIISPLS